MFHNLKWTLGANFNRSIAICTTLWKVKYPERSNSHMWDRNQTFKIIFITIHNYSRKQDKKQFFYPLWRTMRCICTISNVTWPLNQKHSQLFRQTEYLERWNTYMWDRNQPFKNILSQFIIILGNRIGSNSAILCEK